RLLDQQPGILKNMEGMRYFVGFPAYIAGNPAGGVVSLGYGGEHRMIQRRVADLGLLGEQVPGFPEERGLRVQHRPDHPCIEVGEVCGGVFAQEFPSVCGSSAYHRMHEYCQLWVGNLPEPCRVPVAEGVDDQFEACPPS